MGSLGCRALGHHRDRPLLGANPMPMTDAMQSTVDVPYMVRNPSNDLTLTVEKFSTLPGLSPRLIPTFTTAATTNELVRPGASPTLPGAAGSRTQAARMAHPRAPHLAPVVAGTATVLRADLPP